MALKPMGRVATGRPVSTPAAATANSLPPTPAKPSTATGQLVAHDPDSGQLVATQKIGEFDKSALAPRAIPVLVKEAFPTPSASPKYSPDEQLQILLDSAEKAVEKRSGQSARSAAEAIMDRTQRMPNGVHAIGVLPAEAIKVFINALTLGFGIDTSRLPTASAKPASVKQAAAMQEASELGDSDEEWGDLDLDDDIPF